MGSKAEKIVTKKQLRERWTYRVGEGEINKVRRMVKKEEMDPLSGVLLKLHCGHCVCGC